jgi:large subunit ribosomal protein L22
MEVRSLYRYARMSPFKVRQLTREIQGLPAAEALDIINFSPLKASRLVGQTLKSAIANAENNHNLDAARLIIKEATVGEGPTIKRIMTRARGSAAPIRRRTSHIRIILTDEGEMPLRGEARQEARRAAWEEYRRLLYGEMRRRAPALRAQVDLLEEIARWRFEPAGLRGDALDGFGYDQRPRGR